MCATHINFSYTRDHLRITPPPPKSENTRTDSFPSTNGTPAQLEIVKGQKKGVISPVANIASTRVT